MTDQNAYAAVIVKSAQVSRRPRLLHRFAVLNAILIGLPLLFAITVYTLLAVNGIQISGSSGTLGMETVLTVVGYVVLPNMSMAIFWHIRRRGRSSGKHP